MRSTLVALLATITLAAPAAATAHADSMTLAVTPEPVANLTSVITYSAYSEGSVSSARVAFGTSLMCRGLVGVRVVRRGGERARRSAW